MLKKKKIFRLSLKLVFDNVEERILREYLFGEKKLSKIFSNIFRVTTSYKQLFFSFLNTFATFTKLVSTGLLLKSHVKKFKFFKKSIFCINPLVMIIRYSFIPFFNNLYAIECLNYSKKQFIFLKKFLNSVKFNLKFLIFNKTWVYTTKPVKRIKRRVTKLLKNL